MEPFQWALILKPIVLFILCIVVLYPVRRWLTRRMKDGKLKRLLLRRIN